MRFAILFLCAVCLVGCTAIQKISDPSVPQLLLKHPLPPIPTAFSRVSFDLDVVLFVREDGSVGKARLLKGSGNASWDSLAVESIKQWRFLCARSTENQPISSWTRIRTVVRYDELKLMNLEEILCTTKEEADSVYNALELGQNFGDLAMKYSVDPSREMRGVLGEININMYPESIYKSLENLKFNSYTEPIKYGDLYVIFKRVSK
jgi:hypothetical protein